MLDQVGKYEQHQDSHQPWLGKIPTEWKLVRNKAVFAERTEAVGKFAHEYKLLSLTLGGVIPRDMDNPKGKFPAEFDTYKIVDSGDLVLCLFDVQETPRTVGISRERGMITGAYTVLRVRPGFNAEFLTYYHLAMDHDKRLRYLYTGLRNVIKIDTFMSIKSPIPDIATQQRIVNFLDEKTAEIDEAIGKKRRLIELLNEQKAILINQAVTRGLDPSVPTKDSGVEWIGEIPAHWEVKRFKFLIKKLIGGSTPSMDNRRYWDGDTPWASPKDMRAEALSSTMMNITDAGREANSLEIVPIGSLVFVARSGVLKNRIPVALTSIPLTLNQDMKAVLPKALKPAYIFALFTGLQTTLLERVTKMGATVDSIEVPDLMNLKIPYPQCRSEQTKIVDYCETISKACLEAVQIQNSQIDLLNEFKQTLIANAVTGKIKV